MALFRRKELVDVPADLKRHAVPGLAVHTAESIVVLTIPVVSVGALIDAASALADLDLDTSIDSAVTVVEWGAGLAEGLADSRLEVVIERTVGDAAVGDELDPRRVSLRWIVGQ